MGRAPCCDKVGLKKGPWTPEEDQILVSFIQHHGHSNWRALPKQAGLLRCGKSCRLRWINYLRPDIKRGNFSREEEDTIIQLHEMMGNRWSAIAARLPGRTDNEIKNVWHTHLKKRLKEYQPNEKISRKSRETNHNNSVSTTTEDNSSSGNSSPSESTSDHNIITTSTQQSSTTTSDDLSYGTEVSSIELPSDTSYITTDDVHLYENSFIKESSSNLEYLPIIDETFWEPEDLPLDMINEFDNVMEGNDDQMVQFESFLREGESEVYNNKAGADIFGDDNMDFWLDVFVQAGGAPKLPEF